jgi:RNA polymerase sigma factor (sigma-70 family)
MMDSVTSDLERRVSWAVRNVPPQLREDAQQEAWLGIVAASPRFDGRCSLSTFVARRANGAVQDYLRREDPLSRSERRKVKSGMTDAPRHVGVEHAALVCVEGGQQGAALSADIRDWLPLLTKRQRTVILGLLAGESQSEISSRLGVTVGAVSIVYNTAVRRLRQRLKLTSRLRAPGASA